MFIHPSTPTWEIISHLTRVFQRKNPVTEIVRMAVGQAAVKRVPLQDKRLLFYRSMVPISENCLLTGF